MGATEKVSICVSSIDLLWQRESIARVLEGQTIAVVAISDERTHEMDFKTESRLSYWSRSRSRPVGELRFRRDLFPSFGQTQPLWLNHYSLLPTNKSIQIRTRTVLWSGMSHLGAIRPLCPMTPRTIGNDYGGQGVVRRRSSLRGSARQKEAQLHPGGKKQPSPTELLCCRAKPKGSICLLYKWADTAFWLCRAV